MLNCLQRTGSYRKRHLWHGVPLLSFFVFAAVISIDPINHISHCVVQRLFGIPCPFCGLTRALGNLYRWRILAAWQLNPAVFAFFPMGVALLIYRITCVIRPRSIRIPLQLELALYCCVFLLFIAAWITRLCLKAYA